MSHSKTPYSPNFPLNQGYAPPPEVYSGCDKSHYPTAPQPQAAPYPPAQTSPYPPPYPVPSGPQHGASGLQMEPGFKPSYQPGYPPASSPAPPYPPQHIDMPHPVPVFTAQQPSHAPAYHPPAFPQHAPITLQPVGAPGGWMNIPQSVSNCPRGLEYLTLIDQLLVHQKVELLEAFVGFETNNKYTVKNSVGQKVYYAVEDNDCCTRMCCGPIRPFDMKIFDNHRNEVIHLYRPFGCDSCCFPCCLQRIEVSAPPGKIIGTVEQQWSLCKPLFMVKNAAGEDVLQIKGPLCRYSCGGDVKFNIYSKDGNTKVGKITKQWSGLAREFFTDSDYFGITFPMDLDVNIKATLLGACFLIDFIFYEKSGSQERDGPGML